MAIDPEESAQRCIEIAKKLGMPPKPELETYELIRAELYKEPIDSCEATTLAGLFSQWVKSRNPYYIDIAITKCHKLGIAPSKTMLREVAASSALRLRGAPSGTAKQIIDQNAEALALTWMANMLFAIPALSVSAAAEKAAVYYAANFPSNTKKMASTLERYYLKKIRRSGQESEWHSRWRRPEFKHPTDTWIAIANSCPPCPDELKGSAR